jgi:type II secretory pathway component PulF
MMATVHAGGGQRTAEVLRFLSRYYESRFSRTAVLVQNALMPAAAIGFGVVVAILAWGMFAPMVRLVERLSADVGRL